MDVKSHPSIAVSASLAAHEGSGLRKCRICRPLFYAVPLLIQLCVSFFFSSSEQSASNCPGLWRPSPMLFVLIPAIFMSRVLVQLYLDSHDSNLYSNILLYQTTSLHSLVLTCSLSMCVDVVLICNSNPHLFHCATIMLRVIFHHASCFLQFA